MARIITGLMTAGIVAGAVFLAYAWGGGKLPPLATPPTPAPEQRVNPTRFPFDDRGRDTGRQYTPAATPGPANMKTAEAWSLSVYKTAVAGAEYPSPSPAITWADALPDCSSGHTPCTFRYSNGPPAPVAPNLATGGVNEGTDAHPQKDTDLAADPWGGDKP